MRRIFVSALMAVAAIGLVASQASASDLDQQTEAWLQEAKLGPYAEPTLYELALQEGEVTVYSYTSRIHDVGRMFMERFPGITAHTYDMDTPEIISRVMEEQRAGQYRADLIWLKDPPTAYFEMYLPGIIHNWVPPHVAHLIPDELKEPLMRIHHASLSAWFYNTEVYDESPVTNLWDLTTDEWRGRVVLPDIVLLTEYIATFGSIVYHADEMEQAYVRRFGEEIELSRGIENAGWEWIYRVLRNDPLIVRTTHEVTEVVGEPGQDSPPVGLSAFSRLRDLERWPERRFGVAWELVDPVFAFLHTNVHGFVRFAPNPNAAKLFLTFQLGDDYDFTGNKPYQVLGNWLVRRDGPVPEGAPPLAEVDYWDFDVEWVWDHYVQIVDFWTLHRP